MPLKLTLGLRSRVEIRCPDGTVIALWPSQRPNPNQFGLAIDAPREFEVTRHDGSPEKPSPSPLPRPARHGLPRGTMTEPMFDRPRKRRS